MTDLLSERVALVTGAGRGIGLGIAQRLAEEGATVVVGELDRDRAREARQSLVSLGYTADAFELDVTDPVICARVANDILAKHGKLDILVNNAGLATLQEAEALPPVAWSQQIDVMLTGVFLCSQAFGRMMIGRGSGSIVNIASIGGMGGWPMRSAYNAAKAGVINLTEVLATEWAHFGLRVNCVSPGVTRTSMLDVAVDRGLASLERYSARTPIGRVAEIREIAEVVLFLASERSSYVTGQNIRVDGGWVPWGNPAAVGYPSEADR
jgi:NAD(P)-dependent dehydrogenase (short-subunit alcohol dehydrogenase family)